MSNVTSFNRNGRYTDFRVLVREVMEQNPDCKRGILILFKENGDMKTDYVSTSSQLAFAGADLAYRSVTDMGD